MREKGPKRKVRKILYSICFLAFNKVCTGQPKTIRLGRKGPFEGLGWDRMWWKGGERRVERGRRSGSGPKGPADPGGSGPKRAIYTRQSAGEEKGVGIT